MDTQVDMGLKVHVTSFDTYTEYTVQATDYLTEAEIEQGYHTDDNGYNVSVFDYLSDKISRHGEYKAYEKLYNNDGYQTGFKVTPKLDFEYTGNAVCHKCNAFTEQYTCLDSHVSEVAPPRCMECWTRVTEYWARQGESRYNRHFAAWDVISRNILQRRRNDEFNNSPEESRCDACRRIMDLDHVSSNEDYFQVIAKNYGNEVRVHKRCSYTCGECNELHVSYNMWTSINNIEPTHSYHHRNMCDSCFESIRREREVFYCEGCGTNRDSDDSEQYGNNRVCEQCWDDRGECDDCGEDYISNLHYCDGERYIHNYSYMPSLNFIHRTDIHDADHNKQLYMGFELEIECEGDHSRSRVAKEIDERMGSHRVYIKSDGSLDNGIELVTHPHTLAAYQGDFKWDTLKHIANNMGCVSWNTDTCGLHVHVSRETFGITDNVSHGEVTRNQRMGHYIRFTKLLYTNQSQIEMLAGRSGSSYASFNDKGKLFEKFSNRNEDRYTAVNACPHWTLEVRVFKGSLRKERVLSALELVHASVEYTRTLKATPTAFGWVKFISYVADNVEKYPNLTLILNEQYARNFTRNEDN